MYIWRGRQKERGQNVSVLLWIYSLSLFNTYHVLGALPIMLLPWETEAQRSSWNQ
jgi:hypothetical protein